MSISSSSLRPIISSSKLMPLNFAISQQQQRCQALIVAAAATTHRVSSSHLCLFGRRSISFQRIMPTNPKLPLSFSSSPPKFAAKEVVETERGGVEIENLPTNLQNIIKQFQSVEDAKVKYEQILYYSKKLVPLDNHFKTMENKVRGCVSQVWVRAYLHSSDNVVFEADSDSVLTKGLAALLVEGLSGVPVQDILRLTPDFVVLLGIQQSLSPSRNNGFLNMFKLMQKKALQAHLDAANENKNPTAATVETGEEQQQQLVQALSSDSDINALSGKTSDNSSRPGGSGVLGSRGERIKETLERELSPSELEIEDVSYQHAGHAGVRGATGGETHFNLKVVSAQFEGKSLVKRHRLIYGLLEEELQNGLHALSIVAKTPSEIN